MKAFLKQTLIETVQGFRTDTESLASNASIELERLRNILDPDTVEAPTESEYRSVLNALPASLVEEIQRLKPASVNDGRDANIVEELEFAERVVGLLANQATDEQLPLVAGLQRHLRRILLGL